MSYKVEMVERKVQIVQLASTLRCLRCPLKSKLRQYAKITLAGIFYSKLLLCKKYKDEYDAKFDEYKKQVNWNDKMKKHTIKLPREGYPACAVREYYPDLQGLKHDDTILVKAVKLGKRCYDQVAEDKNEVTERPSKSKFRQPGGRRKVVAPTVREALYEWFIDVRGSLKLVCHDPFLSLKQSFFIISGVISNLTTLNGNQSSCFQISALNIGCKNTMSV